MADSATPWHTAAMWISGPGTPAGQTSEGEERTIVSRSLIERVISGLLDERIGVRYAVLAEVIDAVPQWWYGGPVTPHVKRTPDVD